ncbi:MAG TPA: alpha/beta fold hydrolase [Acidobacteriaceae bacterium]
MSNSRVFLDTTTTDAPVRGFLHESATDGDALVLAHGAGADCSAPLLVAVAVAFCAAGVTVLRIDLPFRQLRPHGPPPRGSAERDQAGLRAAVEAMRSRASGRVFMGGHSYGGRQASMLAASDPGLVEALLLLSYPLHPPKRREELRTAHFPRLETSALFVHGSRDGFGSTAELEEARKLIPGRTDLLAIPSAGHELLTKQNRETLPRLCVERFLAFVNAC